VTTTQRGAVRMQLELRFPHKRVLITGANSGFGKAMAMHFGRYGIGVTVSCPAAFTSDILNKEGVDLNRSATLRSLDKDQQTGRHTSESVAAHAIRSMERSHLYDIAHDSMEVLWFIKRLMPETIYRIFAWMYANRKWRFKDASVEQ